MHPQYFFIFPFFYPTFFFGFLFWAKMLLLVLLAGAGRRGCTTIDYKEPGIK